MSVALLHPAGLAALAALAVPIAIHLARRAQERATAFAALRFLGARQPPRQRLRVDELLLLALRLLLIAAIALWLARPVWLGVLGAEATYVAVVPGARPSTAEAHWLAPGFPRVDSSAPRAGATASLLRELDAQLPAATTLIVLAPESVEGLDGERPRLRHRIELRIVPRTMAVAAPPGAPTRVALRSAPGMESQARYARAALEAWSVAEPGAFELDVQSADAPVGEDTRWLVALGANADAASVRARGGVVLTDADVTFDPARNPAVLDADFPATLLARMRGERVPVLAPAQALEPDALDAPAAPPARALDRWIAMLVAALFVLERVVATWRRRA